jgi:type II secretory pathway pseudopilin PulG
MWVSGLLVVGSLLAVVVGDALITQGQVRLSATQHQMTAAIATQKALQVAVAEKAAPPVVVKQAKSQGLVAPSQVVYLPRVKLNVPLPVPQTVPAPATAALPASTTPSASPGATAGSGPPPASTATTVPAKR